jgi:hypothetical protein
MMGDEFDFMDENDKEFGGNDWSCCSFKSTIRFYFDDDGNIVDCAEVINNDKC